MRLDPFVRDYRAFIDALVAAIENNGTKFYLDTSILAWLIRLGSQARQEFISWCVSRPEGSIRIPTWAAHELHRHVIGGTIRANVQKTVSDALAKFDEFVRLASERADDTTCREKGYPNRSSFVSELEYSSARLSQLSRVAQVDDEQLQVATAEVIAFANERLMATDITPIIQNLSTTGSFRYSHFVPPGYHDKKEENRYGDVIIWEEILIDLLSARTHTNGNSDAILVSRDQKTDWVSAAPFVRDARGDTRKSNRDEELDVTLPHPFLMHEFALRAHGNRFFVTQPGFLASVIDIAARRGSRASGVSSWLASSHRPDLLPRLAGSSLFENGPPSESSSGASHQDTRSEAVQMPTLAGAAPAIEAASVVEVMSPPVTLEVRTYYDALPPERLQILEGWLSSLREGGLLPYKFGRILAELAATDVPRWLESVTAVVERLSGVLSDITLNSAVLALTSSVYFDQYGELNRVPNVELGSVLIPLERIERLQPAFNTLRRFLLEANAMLPYVPGSGRGQVRFVIHLAPRAGNSPRLIQDIRVGQQSAVSDPLSPDSTRSLSRLLGRAPVDACVGREIRALVAREYLIPIDLLQSQLDSVPMTWSPVTGLVSLDTGSEGGLSALADEDNGHD